MKNDWGEQFDASVGLTFSLKALERYRASGVLSAEVRAIPGVRGQCQAFLELIEGMVVSCYFIDRTGTYHPTMKESLIKLEQTKGPFGWTFRQVSASALAKPWHESVMTPSTSQAPSFPVPVRLVDQLEKQHLQQWTPEQQQCLSLVFSLINGRRGIDEIKEKILLPPSVVDEMIRILLVLHAIVMQ